MRSNIKKLKGVYCFYVSGKGGMIGQYGRTWLRMYNVGCLHFKVIEVMYDNSLASLTVKGSESKYFRIDSCVRKGCIMSFGFLICIWTQ